MSDYDYQTSMRNMQLLFKLMCNENLEEMVALFTSELHTQQKWSTGDNHFNICNECESVEVSFKNVPRSLAEMVFYILLEQADTQNSRKLEIAIYAIFLLGLHFREIMHIITEQWSSFSQNQEECLLVVITRWANGGICSKELHEFLMDMYSSCSELTRKYYLHSVLLQLKDPHVEVGVVQCTAPPISFEFPADGFAEEDNCYRNFLSLVERYTGKTEANAIRKCLHEASPLEHYVKDSFGNDGDSSIPVISTYPGKIFYGKEKCGEWDEIPLGHKKARLIPLEDPFLLTEMPYMVFDSEWFPDITVTHDGKQNPELTQSDLRDIAHSHIGEDEIVLAANLRYPWGYREGTIYTESSKIDLRIKMDRPIRFDFCLGSYGLLINENSMDESCYTTFGTGGVSLFNRVCGSFKLYYGNCQLAPSSVWRDFFKCNPKNDDPYTWIDRSGVEVLRFERIASPVREIMREAYIRQPILFRWICNKSWLEELLRRKHLCLIPFGVQEKYPYLGD